MDKEIKKVKSEFEDAIKKHLSEVGMSSMDYCKFLMSTLVILIMQFELKPDQILEAIKKDYKNEDDDFCNFIIQEIAAMIEIIGSYQKKIEMLKKSHAC